MSILLTTFYITGITAEGVTGALSAGRQKMDVFGVMAIAVITALGGGSVRDMVLNTYPLTWVAHPHYLVIVLVAAALTMSLSFLMHHFRVLFLLLDAVGLAAFSVLGTRVALDAGHGFIIAAVASVITGVFGGVLRDLMSDRVPLVFSQELYASIAVATTAVYMVLLAVGVPESITMVVALFFALIARCLAMYYQKSLPIFEYRGADQPVDPRIRLSYRLLRRGMSQAKGKLTPRRSKGRDEAGD